MRGILQAFKQYVRAVKSDMILYICLLAPILMGVVFKFCIPVGEQLLCDYFEKVAIISPYYSIFDMLVTIMTPTMFAFTGAMVMMDESDKGLSHYLIVTPLGKSGYLLSRLGIQTGIAIVYDIIVLVFFNLSVISFITICIMSVLGAFSGIITALMIVALAGNKVEALAMSKLSGIMMIGIPVAILVKDKIQYLASIIPSFWMTKYFESSHISYVILALVTSIIWIMCLYKKFEQKIIL